MIFNGRFILTVLVAALAFKLTGAGKLSFEDCTTDAECESPRSCLTWQGRVIPCGVPGLECMCAEFSVSPCTSSSSCVKGEQCARASFMPFATCTSCKSPLTVTPIDGDNECQSAQPARPVVPYGLTGDFCKRDKSHYPCVGQRTCGRMLHGIYSPCTEKFDVCYCLPDIAPPCTSSTECSAGERCVLHTLAQNATMCLSCRATPLFSFLHPIDHAVSC